MKIQVRWVMDKKEKIEELRQEIREIAQEVAKEHLRVIEHMRKYIEMFDISVELVEKLEELERDECECECCCPCKKKPE